MKRSTVLSILLPLFVISSCLEDKSPVIPSTPLSPEEQVIANCYTVQQAAEDFAVENNGVYPADPLQRTPLGNTLLDLLPGGVKLENPFTQLRSEPIYGVALLSGQTGYWPAVDSLVVGYTISGYGADSLIITLTP